MFCMNFEVELESKVNLGVISIHSSSNIAVTELVEFFSDINAVYTAASYLHTLESNGIVSWHKKTIHRRPIRDKRGRTKMAIFARTLRVARDFEPIQLGVKRMSINSPGDYELYGQYAALVTIVGMVLRYVKWYLEFSHKRDLENRKAAFAEFKELQDLGIDKALAKKIHDDLFRGSLNRIAKSKFHLKDVVKKIEQ